MSTVVRAGESAVTQPGCEPQLLHLAGRLVRTHLSLSFPFYKRAMKIEVTYRFVRIELPSYMLRTL